MKEEKEAGLSNINEAMVQRLHVLNKVRLKKVPKWKRDPNASFDSEQNLSLIISTGVGAAKRNGAYQSFIIVSDLERFVK